MNEQDMPQEHPLKRQLKKSFIFLVIILILLLLALPLIREKYTENCVTRTVTVCMDALQTGDLNMALSHSDYAGDTETLLNEITGSENFSSSNIIENALIQFLSETQEWQNVLEYALTTAVQAYRILNIECEEDSANVVIEIDSPDFIAAASIYEYDVLELLTDSYGLTDLKRIAGSAIGAVALPNTVTIGNAVKEVLGPLYDQWPEYVKKSIDTVDTKTITITLTLKKENGTWVILSRNLIEATEIYAAKVGCALIPDLGE